MSKYNIQNNIMTNSDKNTKEQSREETSKEVQQSQESMDEQSENIKNMGIPNVGKVLDESIQIIPIIGQIEGHMAQNPQTKTTKYEHIIPMLIAMERDKNVKGILTVLNTVGGDVEAGLAIAEIIRSLSKPTVSLVIGGGHSIGVPLATASCYSFISPSATMIIHPIRMNGLVIGVPQTFNYFNKMQERISDFIVRTSNIKIEFLDKLMLETKDLLNDMGTILIGKQAVDCGLINEVGGVQEALKKLNDLIEESEKNKE